MFLVMSFLSKNAVLCAYRKVYKPFFDPPQASKYFGENKKEIQK